ncbi:L,D-transpeptidase [Mesorhizobium muleiense]|uniref:L,D-transpeptidase catalytic domain n=1 Tax=Mesorhizobium muleiense TaxID=1004279 RepID=A0A1G8ZSM1_9HYPH|nr:L,D-transpeptidase [Mesorhizobium muleiense]MCF6099195.1 L,D-transpeptidase [Mesorhizobium muleiense]SDK18116.1 L,D-transpeptidase catalytic domain [Mesorhizobium muleiense]
MEEHHIARRGLVLGTLALMLSGCTSTLRQVTEPISSAFGPRDGINPRFRRRQVRYDGNEPPGTIVVDTSQRFLYAVETDGWATRYGVGVGEQGLSFKGTATIARKADWPSWTPTTSMMRRKPRLVKYAGGVPGGPNNPLGARALYLYRNGRDTYFRIHGTNEPWTIGTAVSNGCIRLTNDDIIDLYERTPLGTTVVVV